MTTKFAETLPKQSLVKAGSTMYLIELFGKLIRVPKWVFKIAFLSTPTYCDMYGYTGVKAKIL